MNINEIIRSHREKRNITQKEMAKMLFIQHNTYSQYETGARRIEAEMLFKIANILKINLLSYQSEDIQKSTNNKDYLTKIHNRKFFFEKVEEYINNNQPFALCLIDLDDFKHYNDLYGHNNGDKILISLGEVLEASGLECGRIGGEEFGLLIPNKNNDSKQHLLEIKKQFKNKHSYITFSIGISHFQQDGKKSEDLYLKADEALYKAKLNGKNSIVEF